MVQRFWVGGGASTNFNATGNTNWAATSGGANNASVPTTGDEAIFDANSGSGTCVLNASVSLLKLDAHAFAGTLTHNTSVTITITGAAADSLRLPNTGTFSPQGATALFSITSTSGTTDITSNGKRMGGLTLNGAGGTFRLLDALRVDAFSTSVFTLTAGTFNANNFNVTTNSFSSNNSNTRTLTLGSGTWTLGASAAAATFIWNTGTTTNLTFNKNTANIVVPTNNLAGYRAWTGGSLTFNGITIDSNTAKGVFFLTGGCTFSSFAIGAGNILAIQNGQTLTSSAGFTYAGTPALPAAIISGDPGSQGTLSVTSGSVVIEWGTIRDIVCSGGATFTATNTLDLGNNSGISISPPSALTIPSANDNADALLDRVAGVETGLTVRQALRLISSVLLGKASGLGTATAVFRDVNDTKDRVTATVDADGNRAAVTRDAA